MVSPTLFRSNLRPWLGFMAWICLGSTSLLPQARRPNAQSEPGKKTSSTLERSTATCGCPDGRHFAVGASLFGKGSSRVLITKLQPDPPPRNAGDPLTPCTDIAVLGQAIRLVQVPDDRPFLKRESLKRGMIPDICATKIQFAEAKRLYDFFADDGSAVTLTGDETGPATPSDAAGGSTEPNSDDQDEIGLNQDLTGKDLIRLIPSKLPDDDPAAAAFDADDLKEGAYFIARKRFKTSVAPDIGPGGMTASSTRSVSTLNEVTVSAGTLGRIEKRAGFRSEPLWVAEILPDSVPRPFWRSLLALPKVFTAQPPPPRKVIVPSSQVVEINHFLDQYGVEWTRFGKEFENTDTQVDNGTNRLPDVYAPPALPLDENISIAQRARVLETIQASVVGLRLQFKDSSNAVRRTTMVLDDSDPDSSPIESSPHLLHRQCFVGLGQLTNTKPQIPLQTRPALRVTDVDIRIFQPDDLSQAPSDYYAVDLQFLVKPNFSAGEVPIVCRFPSAPINLALGQMAERILSTRFEIREQKEK